MTTNKEDIRRWLDLYMEGKTSLEEEAPADGVFPFAGCRQGFCRLQNHVQPVRRRRTFFHGRRTGKVDAVMPTGRNSRLLCPTDRSSDATEAHTSHKANRRTVDSGSFRRSRMFFLGTTVSRKEATQPTNSISIPPTVLTEVKWKTDTVFIEKPVPTTLTAKIITVRDTIVLPASHPKGQMWATLSTGQDTSSTETASIPCPILPYKTQTRQTDSRPCHTWPTFRPSSKKQKKKNGRIFQTI